MKDMQEKAKDVSAILKVLSNEHRLLILCELLKQTMNVSELQEKLEISQSGISQHLSILKAHGIIDNEKKAQSVYYTIKDLRIVKLMHTLYENFCVSNNNSIR